MSNELAKMALFSLLPPGSAWNVKDGGDWDALLEGQATNWETVRVELDKLSEIRNPLTTPLLEDLEREYGVTPNPELTDAVRRQRLAALVYAPDGTGSATYLEARLREAGFDVRVHSNDPAVDPVPYLDTLFGAQLGEPLFQLGEPEAILGSYTSELIVAGDIFRNEFDFLAQCGAAGIQCGTAAAVCGSAQFDISPVEYPDPTDPNRWRYVFFIGGPAVRDLIYDGDMELTTTVNWPKFGTGSVVKSLTAPHGGLRQLTVTNGAGGSPTVAYQRILGKVESVQINGYTERITAGTVPVVRQSTTTDTLGSVVWTGTTGAGYQNFNFSMDLANGRYLQLGTLTGVSPQITYWDDITIQNQAADASDTGIIQSIESAEISADRRDEFLATVIKWKPMHTWGVAIVEWTQ